MKTAPNPEKIVIGKNIWTETKFDSKTHTVQIQNQQGDKMNLSAWEHSLLKTLSK